MNKSGRLPDFLIIGAPRCGTSSLFINLLQHPQITGPHSEKSTRMRPYKEAHFFNKPKRYNRWRNRYGIEWYKSLFFEATKDSLCFEATPSYFFDTHSAQRIFEHLPGGKFIVLLRNPVERAESCLWEREHNGRAWNPDELKKPKYDRIRLIYAEALRRWLSYYPRDRFLIIKSEDYFEDEKKMIAQCFNWLGIKTINIKEPLFYDNRIKSHHREMSDGVKEYLGEFFKPYNQELYELLGRDFGWQ